VGGAVAVRVAVVYNLRRGDPAAGAVESDFADLEAEYDAPATVAALLAAVEACGHAAFAVEADLDCLATLRRRRPDMVFNIAEGLPGESREAQVPVLCEMLGVPHTGSGALTLALCLDKAMTKRVLRAAGVPTPRGTVIAPGATPAVGALPFPLFVKPLREGSSMGVTPESLVADPQALARQVQRIHAAYGEPALVEEFLPGREFTVGLLGNGEPTVLPVTEIAYAEVPPDYPPVYTYRFKREWDEPRFYRCPAPLAPEALRRVAHLARRAFRCLGCRDVARVDVRLDAQGRPRCIDVNPLPGLAPGFSDLPRQAETAGLGYGGLVRAILEAARARYGL
jgi:D-alanine-D-alanine ligase